MLASTRWGCVLCVLVGCGRVAFDASSGGGDAGDAGRDSPDTGPLGAWSTPQPLPGASSGTETEEDVAMSSDGLEAFFGMGSDSGPKYLMTMTRATQSSTWSTPQQVSLATNMVMWSTGPRLTPDDLTLYFNTDRTPTVGGLDIWRLRRDSAKSAWNVREHVSSVSSSDDEEWFAPCGGTAYVMSRGTPNGFVLYEGNTGNGQPPPAVSPLWTGVDQSGPFLTADCLTLYFASTVSGNGDLFVTHRATVSSPWDAPQPLDDFNDPTATEGDPWMSADGRIFAFTSNRNGTDDVFFATR